MTVTSNPVGLVADDVTLGYGGSPVVHALNLDVSPGEILVVLGSSGCGKSTLLRAFAGLLRPLTGRIGADGVPVTSPDAERALVFQDDALLPWRTVLSNVELPLAVRGVPRSERRARAREWLGRVGLESRGDLLPRELSGGMRQRVQLARALAGAPGAVLMDEPFGALDAQSRQAMQRLLIDTWEATGSTVVFVTHDVDEALALGDRVVVLGEGGIVAEYVLDSPRTGSVTPELRDAVLATLGAGDSYETMAVA